MTVDVSEDFEDVDETLVQESRDAISDVMKTKYPDTESGWGPGGQLEGVVVEPASLIFAAIEERMQAQDASFSLATIAANPTAADDELVDLRMSDYFTTRQEATVAFGDFLVVVGAQTIIPITEGFLITVGNIQYQTTRSYRVYPSDSGRSQDVANGILVMELRDDGNFEFLLPVESIQTGSATLLARGASGAPQTRFPNQVSVTAAEDFQGGLDEDSNADLVARAQQGITPEVFSGSRHIRETIEKQFPGSLVSLVRSGDAFMSRDRSNLFGISVGGKTDLYVRTNGYPLTATITVTAQLSPENRAERRWVFTYNMAGAYEVTAIRDAGEVAFSGTRPEKETVTAVPPVTGFVPKMSNADAVFTAHQLRTVEFINEDIDIGSPGPNDVVTHDFDVDVFFMPSVDDVDVFSRDLDRLDPGLDALVRAAVPVAVDVSVTVRGTVDIAAAQEAIVSAILDLEADADRIPANLVYNALADLVDGTVGTVTFRADILGQNLTHKLVTATGELVIEDDLARGISVDTFAFVTQPSRINITVA